MIKIVHIEEYIEDYAILMWIKWSNYKYKPAVPFIIFTDCVYMYKDNNGDILPLRMAGNKYTYLIKQINTKVRSKINLYPVNYTTLLKILYSVDKVLYLTKYKRFINMDYNKNTRDYKYFPFLTDRYNKMLDILNDLKYKDISKYIDNYIILKDIMLIKTSGIYIKNSMDYIFGEEYMSDKKEFDIRYKVSQDKKKYKEIRPHNLRVRDYYSICSKDIATIMEKSYTGFEIINTGNILFEKQTYNELLKHNVFTHQ